MYTYIYKKKHTVTSKLTIFRILQTDMGKDTDFIYLVLKVVLLASVFHW